MNAATTVSGQFSDAMNCCSFETIATSAIAVTKIIGITSGSTGFFRKRIGNSPALPRLGPERRRVEIRMRDDQSAEEAREPHDQPEVVPGREPVADQ